MSELTVSYRVSFRKRDESALVAVSRRDAPAGATEPAPTPAATARDTPPPVATDAHPTARLLALAYRIEQLIEAGELRDYREAATRFGISHARMSQVTGMLLLPPRIQADILLGRREATEGGLRRIVTAPNWPDQQLSKGQRAPRDQS